MPLEDSFTEGEEGDDDSLGDLVSSFQSKLVIMSPTKEDCGILTGGDGGGGGICGGEGAAGEEGMNVAAGSSGADGDTGSSNAHEVDGGGDTLSTSTTSTTMTTLSIAFTHGDSAIDTNHSNMEVEALAEQMTHHAIENGVASSHSEESTTTTSTTTMLTTGSASQADSAESPSTLKELCRRANPFDTIGVGQGTNSANVKATNTGADVINNGAVDHARDFDGEMEKKRNVIEAFRPAPSKSSAVPFEAQVYVKGKRVSPSLCP